MNSYCMSIFQGSGQWSGEKPICVAYSIEAIVIFSIVALVVLVFNVSLGCCLCSRKIKVVLFMKFGLSFGQRLEMRGKLYDVYVIYNEDGDWQFVENQVMFLLEENKLKVANKEDCLPGQDRFSSLKTMFEQSSSALIVLTENFLKSRWNLYDLNQAVITGFQQKNFKVVFLLCQKLKTLGKLPENLSLILNLCTTVKTYKRNWQDSLMYEVTHKTHRPLSKRLSLRNKRPKLPDLDKIHPDFDGMVVPETKRRHSV